MNIRYVKNLLDEGLEGLLVESKKEGYNIIKRLMNDFRNGDNKFNKKGEALVVYEENNEIIGICGLNVDPINNKRGRIRRLYVLPQYRNKGIGEKLVKELVNYSINNFKSVSVNIGNLDISEFYEKLGFQKHNEENGITHLLTHN
jgi:ribosomal protein S18 acetylase RimI-like enzyme